MRKLAQTFDVLKVLKFATLSLQGNATS